MMAINRDKKILKKAQDVNSKKKNLQFEKLNQKELTSQVDHPSLSIEDWLCRRLDHFHHSRIFQFFLLIPPEILSYGVPGSKHKLSLNSFYRNKVDLKK